MYIIDGFSMVSGGQVLDISTYYRDKNVQRCMIEFMGGTSLDDITCKYISNCDGLDASKLPVSFPRELPLYLASADDVGRSLWDRDRLIAHLDIEYVNFDFPADPYLDPTRCFALQQPVQQTIESLFAAYNIIPLHLLSGRGHHYVWSISKRSATFRRLAELGPFPQNLALKYATPKPPCNEPVDPATGAAFAGLGLLMEYVAYRILDTTRSLCELPVKLTAVTVGQQQRGREIISIDISEYGDPLHTRMIRVPFSVYLKPWRSRGILHDGIRTHVPPMVLIPAERLSILDAITTMRSVDRAARLAARESMVIPDCTVSTATLLNEYLDSDVAQFHRYYYSQSHEEPNRWPSVYDNIELAELPGCAARLLQNPNDLLLKPASLEFIVRVMLAKRWHPRQIAGLIRSKYERDYGWGGMWYIYDAATHADFYVRLFSGLMLTGRDDTTDFDCSSTRAKGICDRAEPSCTLSRFQEMLTREVHSA